MSKTIKLEDEVYLELDELRVKAETYSQAVERLLKVFKQLRGIVPLVNPGVSRREDQS